MNEKFLVNYRERKASNNIGHRSTSEFGRQGMDDAILKRTWARN